jgi:lipopolysaccharide export system protein LptA
MEGSNNITGNIITYYIDEEKSVVSGEGTTRVNATIQPPPKKGNAGPR